MVRVHPRRVVRGHAQEEEHARHRSLVGGEILRGRLPVGLQQLLATHALQRRQHAAHQRRIVVGHAVAEVHLHLGRATAALRDAFGRAPQPFVQLGAHAGVEGADRADHLHVLGHDVVAHAAVDRADGEHRGRERGVDLARHDRLPAEHDLARQHHRVHARPGQCAVRLPPEHVHAEAVGRGHDALLAPGDRADGQRHHVQAEDRLHLRVGQRAFLDHQRRAPALADGRAFLCRLEDEHDRPGDLGAVAAEHLGRAHEHRDMVVVAAGVHHADVLAVVGAAHRRAEGQVHQLDHRQRVHVCAQCDHGARLAATQHADDAGVRHLRTHLEAEGAQVIGHELRGAELAVAEFRVLVDVAPPGHDLRQHGGDVCLERCRGYGARCRGRGRHEREGQAQRHRRSEGSRARGQGCGPVRRRTCAHGDASREWTECGAVVRRVPGLSGCRGPCAPRAASARR